MTEELKHETADGEVFTGEVWGIRNKGGHQLIPALDCDGNFLAYFSEETAQAAAIRSNEMYDTDAEAVRIV